LRRYRSPTIRASLHEAGIRSCIPPKSNRKAKIRWNRRMSRERNRIERRIGQLKINRAIATRYDKLARIDVGANKNPPHPEPPRLGGESKDAQTPLQH